MNQNDFRALLAQATTRKVAGAPAPATTDASAAKAKPKFKPKAQRKEEKKDEDAQDEGPKYRDRAAERRSAIADEVRHAVQQAASSARLCMSSRGTPGRRAHDVY